MLQINIAPTLLEWGYENPCLIGQGAFSCVYRIKERATGRFYACKVSAQQKMLRREGQILERLGHPLFPTYHDFKQLEECALLLMEYVPGVNLGALMARRGHLSERQTIRIAMELAEGLCYLHEGSTPILFRDLKPENICIRENGKVKLLDLGSAGPMNTAARVITGTPGYAAPEQLEETDKVGFYSDVYALGRVMHYMLTGKKAKSFCDGAENVNIYSTGIHKGVVNLVEDCLRGEVQERIPDMRCFLNRLAPYASGRRREILCSEIKALMRGKGSAEYIFQQNILR